MTTKKRAHASHRGQTVSDEYKEWVFSHMPAVGRLLDALDAGSTPTFLDIMSALSQMVAFLTECDQKEGCMSTTFFLMSGKRCRFCS